MVEEERERGGRKRNVWVCGGVQFNGGLLPIVTAQIHMGMGGIVLG